MEFAKCRQRALVVLRLGLTSLMLLHAHVVPCSSFRTAQQEARTSFSLAISGLRRDIELCQKPSLKSVNKGTMPQHLVDQENVQDHAQGIGHEGACILRNIHRGGLVLDKGSSSKHSTALQSLSMFETVNLFSAKAVIANNKPSSPMPVNFLPRVEKRL